MKRHTWTARRAAHVKVKVKRAAVLTAAENITKFCVLFPVLARGAWQGRSLGIFTAACLAASFAVLFLERRMWAEDEVFRRLVRSWGRKPALLLETFAFWFFLAQAPVMLRFAGEILRYSMENAAGSSLLRAAGEAQDYGFFRYSFFFLPFLISSSWNSMCYMRRIYLRLHMEGAQCHPALRQSWYYRLREVIWWAIVFLAVVLAVSFRDGYSAAGFYCAYNWELIPGFLAAACIFALCRRLGGGLRGRARQSGSIWRRAGAPR